MENDYWLTRKNRWHCNHSNKQSRSLTFPRLWTISTFKPPLFCLFHLSCFLLSWQSSSLPVFISQCVHVTLRNSCFVRETWEPSLPSQNEFLSLGFPVLDSSSPIWEDFRCKNLLSHHTPPLSSQLYIRQTFESLDSHVLTVLDKKSEEKSCNEKTITLNLRKAWKLPFVVFFFVFANVFRLDWNSQTGELPCSVKLELG